MKPGCEVKSNYLYRISGFRIASIAGTYLVCPGLVRESLKPTQIRLILRMERPGNEDNDERNTR